MLMVVSEGVFWTEVDSPAFPGDEPLDSGEGFMSTLGYGVFQLTLQGETLDADFRWEQGVWVEDLDMDGAEVVLGDSGWQSVVLEEVVSMRDVLL